MRLIVPILLLLAALPSCSRLSQVGKVPEFTPIEAGNQHNAMSVIPLPVSLEDPRESASASLWSRDRRSLLGVRCGSMSNFRTAHR